MFCPKCGQKNIDSAAFCVSCGQNLDSVSIVINESSIKPQEENSAPPAPAVFARQDSAASAVSTAIRTLQDGRYTIMRELGAGGMGKVYLARDEKMEFDVVVKEMLPLMATPREKDYIQKHFKEEAKMLFRLKHCGLPRVTDYFSEDSSICIIMEYIDGKDLESILKSKENKQISIDEFYQWIIKALDVVKYLHSQDPPIIHRDIKPGNIMLTSSGEIFLVDFGVAKAIGMKSGTQTSVGTPGFASPENFFGKYILSSDIYSLGATFHYLLTGDDPRTRNPFDYPPLENYRSDLPKDLQKIMSKILDSDKDKRYTCTEDVVNDLSALFGKPVASASQPFSIAPAKPASAAAASASAGDEASAGNTAEASYAPAQWKKTGDILFEAAICSIAYSPDGSLAACGTGNNDLRTIDPNAKEVLLNITGPTDWVRAVLFSPDGRYIITGSDDKLIRVWEASTGKNMRNLTGHDDWVRSIAYSADGAYIVSGGYDGKVKVWSARAWNLQVDIPRFSEPVSSVAFSPDNKMIANSCDDNKAYVWNPKTAEKIAELEGHTSYVNYVAFSPNGKYLVTTSSDNTVKLWDTKTWQNVRTITGHEAPVTAAVFSPDNLRLVSCSEDKTIRIWITETGECEQVLEEHTYAVYSIAFNPKGKGFMSASGDKTVMFWEPV